MTQQPAPQPADLSPVGVESPTPGSRTKGPTSTPTHPLAKGPVLRPPHHVDGFVREFLRELHFGQGVTLARSTVNDQYLALARTVRHYLMADWLETARRRRETRPKMVGYLSAEYLLGRQLGNALLTTRLGKIVEEGLAACGIDLSTLLAQEVEPGLGNGGLGRLAACFVDSLATMDVSCIGYGIRYECGIFGQTFVDGRQVEVPDSWLALGGPWEFPHPERAVQVDFGGHTEEFTDQSGRSRSGWVPGWNVLGVPYHYMVPGYQNGVVNTLRLWSARATQAFDLTIFNAGDYAEAVRAQTFAENITKVLYPEDSTPQGRALRLQQQYFFVACSLKDYLDQTLPRDFDLHHQELRSPGRPRRTRTASATGPYARLRSYGFRMACPGPDRRRRDALQSSLGCRRRRGYRPRSRGDHHGRTRTSLLARSKLGRRRGAHNSCGPDPDSDPSQAH